MALQNSVYNVITNGILQTGATAGNTGLLKAYNNTTAGYDIFATLTAGLTPTFDLNTLTTINNAYIYRAGGTAVAINSGGTALTATPTDGQLLVGTTATNNYTLTTLTQGANISITNGSGSITIAATSIDETWTPEAIPFAVVAKNGYICSSAATGTLPATAAVGSRFSFISASGAGWIIAQRANQYIVFGNQTSTVGVGGSLAAVSTGDSVVLICTTADIGFTVLSSVGNITVT